jgi:hypothetical protein
MSLISTNFRRETSVFPEGGATDFPVEGYRLYGSRGVFISKIFISALVRSRPFMIFQFPR